MADSYSGISSPNSSWVGSGAAGAAITLVGTGDKYTFVVPIKCYVYRAGFVINVVPGDAATLKFDRQLKNGGARGDGDVAVLTLATTHTAGKMVYKDLTTLVTLEEGDTVVFEATEAAASGSGWPVLIVREAPEVPANNTAMVATA